MDKKKPIRSRTPPSTSPEVRERVAHIADLMAKGRYRTRITIRELSDRWGVKEGTLENDAAEARRLLLVPPEELAARRAEMATWFAARADEARRRRNSVTGLPDVPAALKAMELYGRYAGIEPTDATALQAAPPRIVVTFEGPPDSEPGKSGE